MAATFGQTALAIALAVVPSGPLQTPVPKELKEAKTAYVQNNGVDPRFLERFLI